MSEVTQILNAIDQGDPRAAEQLLPVVYDELRKLAAQKLAQEKPGQTLQATALVHEAYVRLVDTHGAQKWNSRGHFFAAAAEAMRRILVDQARRKQADKRGGGGRSPKAAGLAALAYMQRAEKTHSPTQSFYQIRADCHKAMGLEEAARADQELAHKTSPTMAFDYYQKGQAALTARNKAEGFKAFEAGLRLEPTHFWSMMKLG